MCNFTSREVFLSEVTSAFASENVVVTQGEAPRKRTRRDATKRQVRMSQAKHCHIFQTILPR
jgi:hypothetical protein